MVPALRSENDEIVTVMAFYSKMPEPSSHPRSAFQDGVICCQSALNADFDTQPFGQGRCAPCTGGTACNWGSECRLFHWL